MRFKVFLLRRRGRRLPWLEVVNGPTHTGDLRSHSIERSGNRFHVLTLARADTPTAASAVPELYEPVLLGFTVLSFRLRGYESLESDDGRVGVVQEWHCELP